MTPEEGRLLRETHEMTQANNRMLHAMRRNAFLGGIVKFIFYVLILVVAPLWVYSTYFAPLLQNMQQTLNDIQGTNTKAQQQFTGIQSAWQQFESKLPSFGTTSKQ